MKKALFLVCILLFTNCAHKPDLSKLTTEARAEYEKVKNNEQDYVEKCNQGEMIECTLLAKIRWLDGENDKAYAIASKACAGGVTGGCLLMGAAKLGPINYSQEDSLVEHSNFWRETCEGGDYPAMCVFAAVTEDEGQWEKAKVYLRKASKAKDLFQRYCDKDDQPACLSVGLIEYAQGRVDRAEKLLLKACQKKHEPACKFIGRDKVIGSFRKSKKYIEYVDGICKGGNYPYLCLWVGEVKASIADVDGQREVLKIACDKKIQKGCLELGKIEWRWDEPENKRRLDSLCDGGMPKACMYMGYQYIEKEKIKQAEKYYKKACAAGNKLLCSSEGVAKIVEHAIKQREKDRVKNIKFYETYCNNNERWACVYRANAAEYWEKDWELAKRYLKKACGLGSPDSCYKLYRDARKKGQQKQADDFLNKSCKLDDADACLSLYFERMEEEQPKKANIFLKKSCDLNNGKACLYLYLTVHNEGRLKEADLLLKKACKLKNKEACEIIHDTEVRAKLKPGSKEWKVEAERLRAKAKEAQEKYRKLLEEHCGQGDERACKKLRAL